MAIGVLKIFDEKTLNEVNTAILLYKVSFVDNLNNIQLAYKCKCKQFIADPCVQSVISSLWENKKIDDNIVHEDKVIKIFHNTVLCLKLINSSAL